MYIATLVRFGLLGTIPFLAITFLYYWRLYIAGNRAKMLKDKWLLWCFFSGLVGWNVAFMTTNSYGSLNTLYNLLIAVCCNIPNFFNDMNFIQEK